MCIKSLLAQFLVMAALSSAAVTSAADAQTAPSPSVMQGEKEALYAFFTDVGEGEWHATGEWSAGGAFEQVQRYDLALGGRIVKVHTLIPDSTGTRLIARNEGVRAWDTASGEMRFWEFDRFGGITTGRVGLDDGVVYYEYSYPIDGRTRTLRDEWRPRQDGAYEYRVGVYEDGAWQEVFLQATFRRRPRS